MTDLLLERLALRCRDGLRRLDDLFTLWGAERRGSVDGFDGERRRRWALGPVAVLLGCEDALVDALAKLLLALPCEGRSPSFSTAAMKARR
jgi:hypothetical protein